MEKEIRPTEKVQIYIYYTSFILYYKFNINWSSRDNISYYTYNQLQFKTIHYDITSSTKNSLILICHERIFHILFYVLSILFSYQMYRIEY